jgi:hypothetical protein
MVSGVDSPIAQNNPLIEASTNAAQINQARQGAVLNSSQLVVGKQFQAEVVSSLEDGTYIVKVADVAARMQLPNSPDVGSKVSLTLLSTSPRATFLLNPPEDDQTSAEPTTTTATLGANVKQLIDDFNQTGAKGSATATGLYLQAGANVTAVSNANADPRLINLNAALPDSAPATFSSAGKLVDQLIQNTPQEASVVNVSKVPLLSTPDVNVNAMAKALQSGVSNSGVFYESHLLQWAEGTRDAAELMKEPQASFPTTPGNMQANTATNNPSQNTLINNNPLNYVPTNAQINQDGKINLPTTLAGTTANNTTATSTITLPKDATPLIQQQLQTQEQQRFVWHGELWPGQSMQWEISRDSTGQKQSQQEQTWQSAVNFELPQLGNVSAQLQLTGTHLRLSVNTPNPATALMLQNHANELIGAFDNTGTQLDALTIRATAADTSES